MMSSGKGSGSSSTPAAKSGEGGGTTVSVAAAVAIAIVTAHAISGMPDGALPNGLTLSDPTGVASFSTTEDADSTAKANGSATNASSLNIGAGVAINLIKIQNLATIGANNVIDSKGLALSAVMPSATTGGSDGKNTFDTESTAGAGKGNFGIAGSLALTLADVETNAEIGPNSTRGPPGDALTGSLSLTAVSSVSSTAKAMAKDTDAGTVGIGAGAAINSVNDVTTALIDSNAVITGATSISLSATNTDSETTYAEAGASGGSKSDFSFTADAAISLPTDITTASIAGGTSQTLTTAGAISLTAKQTASATTTAKADATTGDVVIGLALALAVPDDEVTATDSRTINGAAISFSATGASTTTTEADASAAGAKGDSGSGDGSGTGGTGTSVNQKADGQLMSANSESMMTTGKSSSTKNTNNAQATTSDKNSSGGNTVTVAGAAAINVVTSTYRASLADSAHVTATGLLSLKTSANTDASAVGSGKSTDAGTVGVGAGVAVNDVALVNQATTNNAAVTSKGIDLEAAMTQNGKDSIQVFDGTDWKTIDSGTAFPESPSDGDYFQLTKGAPATTTVDADGDLSTGSLTVKATDGFGADGGTFTVEGGTGTCSYTTASGGTITRHHRLHRKAEEGGRR